MAAGVWAGQHGRIGLLKLMLVLTILGGLGFLGIKYVEYEHKWKDGLLWGRNYHPAEPPPGETGMTEVRPGAPAPEAAPPSSAPTSAAATASQSAAASTNTSTAPSASAPASAKAVTSAGAAQDANAAAGPDPNTIFAPAGTGPRGLLGPGMSAPTLNVAQQVHNVQLFFAVYFGLTGLHGIHVIAGILAISWALRRAMLGHFSAAYSTPVHLVGLYWHVVDLIWIYLFPLLYLIH